MFANGLRDTHAEIGVVVVSEYADPRYGLALLERGSRAAPTCSRTGCGSGSR